jgi:hypothetical protein
VKVRDGSGAVVSSGGMSALPVLPEEGHVLVLPPGTYRIEMSVGAQRASPWSFTGTAVPGETRRAE